MALLILGAFASRALGQVPLQMNWNRQTTFGPDGPWQGVQMTVGDDDPPALDGSDVTLYPGGAWQSQILDSFFCNGSSNCLAAEAGLYNYETSQTANGSVQLVGGLGQWDGGASMNLTGARISVLDTFTFADSTGTKYSIPQTIFSAVNSSNVELPNGNFYSTQVGLLALGAPDLAQEFSEGNGQEIQGNLLTGYLRNTSKIPSSSWGLQIGSVMQGQVGSLVLGGYDQSRTLGPVGVFTLSGSTPVVNLIDISMGVSTGGSPFNQTTITGLFQFGGNTTAPVITNPSVPYMQLPQDTCDAIAAYLPVTYQSSSGLYTWNTNDPDYLKIVSSPAYIQFTFAESLTTNVSIVVPFPLMNLTLTTPIINEPQPYFPCKPYYPADGNYILGRAFLQAAFIGVNWEQQKLFMTQAPGPNSGPVQITTINPTDTSIGSNPIDTFINSWQQKWTPLPLPSGSPSSPNSTGTGSAPSSSPTTAGSGLSAGAKIGIGVGIGLAALVAIGALVFFCVRSRRAAEPEPLPEVTQQPSNYSDYDQKPQPSIPGYAQPYQTYHELDAPVIIHETGDGSLPEMSSQRRSQAYQLPS
ncbi:MAG: hypothetical protein MMC33_003783 [Icmadophila ericetorum]|nr:hypothetical protein [Icmadophila ericetorum]